MRPMRKGVAIAMSVKLVYMIGATVFFTMLITAWFIDNNSAKVEPIPEVIADGAALGNTTTLAYLSYDERDRVQTLKEIDNLKEQGFCITHVTNVADGGLAERYVVFVLERCI